MRWFIALVLALLCLAPAAQAGGHFRSGFRGGYGHGGYGFRSFSYAPAFSYSLFTPYIPVQQVVVPTIQTAPVYETQAVEVAAPVCAPAYSTGFSSYGVSSYGLGFNRGFYGTGRRHFHRSPRTVPHTPRAVRHR